jgi:hypothetical protein
MSELTKELYTQHRTVQDQYTYFLLATAAAALAFAVQKTLDRTFAMSMVPLAAATLSWGLSFYYGCRNSGAVQETMMANMEYLQLKEGNHPKQPDNQFVLFAALKGVHERLHDMSERSGYYSRAQFRTLILGGVLFIGWHVYEMYLRTVSTP